MSDDKTPDMLAQNIGHIVSTPISERMQEAYLDYAMSVIVSRALPDVRDGLKPVHRRILYGMNQIGLGARAKYRKCATVVGEVMGKYHPHGDAAIYDTLVRMAQDFSMRYMLVDGQGNFGSIDGDNAAAMRYTECRMEAIAEELLADIKKDTVNFVDNYDGSEQEPEVLPARIPGMLVNGGSGIAVGMATNIPPHNLAEVIDATAFLIDNPEASIEELMEFIKGPDFPTGGFIYNNEDILNAYLTGRGSVTMRAKTEIEDVGRGKNAIIVTEIPYQVNKATLIEKIAGLVRDKKLAGISDLRDESDRRGMRVVIELKRDAIPKVVLNQLFKYTQLQQNFNFNMVALVDGKQPKLLNLKQTIQYYIAHRKEVITRRTEFELKEAKARAHILEGLNIALDNLDEVISTIRGSDSTDDARTNLMEKFALSELQANAILEMQLRRLAALERQKIESEYKEVLELIGKLEGILADPKKILTLIKKDLAEVSEQYGDERRTVVIPHAIGEFNEADLIKEEEVYIAISRSGYIKRMTLDTYRQQRRGGKGIIGMNTKEEDVVEHLFTCSTHSSVLFFTNRGRVFELRAFQIPEASRTAKGQAIVNLLQVEQDELIQSVLPIDKFKEDVYLLFATRGGLVKKTSLSEYDNIRSNGLIAINLKDGDELASVRITDGKQQVLMITQKAMSIRFNETDVRPMGRNSMGVMGIRLNKGDRVVAAGTVAPDEERQKVVVLMSNGFGKATLIKHYPVQGRAGKGVKTAQINPKTGEIQCAMIADDFVQDLVVISTGGQVIRLPYNQVSTLTRGTQGVRLMRLKSGDKVASMAPLREDDEAEVEA